MKIDVITRHSVANYGSILQSYATQRVFEKLGYECEIIDYTKEEEQGKNIAKTLCYNSDFWKKNIITRSIYFFIQTPNYLLSYTRFKKFRKKLLKQTEIEYTSFEQLKNNPPNADIYCSGSDQIWGKIGNENCDKSYFLEFAPNGKKCISYAASIGKTNISDETKSKMKQYLGKYSKILVREKSAVEIINQLGINNVELVLDPTLLLNKDEWNSIIDVKPKYDKYILVYQLHDNKKFVKYAKNFSKKMGLKLVRICPSMQNLIRGGKGIFLPTPQEFMAYFKNAEYVLTDSFHGTVFSLIFNRKFIDILPEETGTRIINILELIDCQDRILKDYNDYSWIGRKIDYENVNSILDKYRKKSIEKLNDAILK